LGEGGMMKVLLLEYKQSLKQLRIMIRNADKIVDVDERNKEKSILKSMERDLLFAIEWMSTGKCPDSYSGIEHRKAYEQKSFPPSFFNRLAAEDRLDSNEDDLIKGEAIDFLLKDLCELERDVFTIIKLGYSIRGAADLLGMKKTKVSRLYSAAEEKVLKRSRMIGY
jgi:positive control factor